MGNGPQPAPAGSAGSSMWPFLVGSGRTASQQVILAPEFMIARKIAALLLLATGSPGVVRTGLSSSTAWRCQVKNGEADEFNIIFRVSRVGPELLESPDGVVLDDSSRPVYISEGVVLLGGSADITEAAFGQVRAVTESVYRDFWQADGRLTAPRTSQPLPSADRVPQDPALVMADLPPLTYSGPASAPAIPASGRTGPADASKGPAASTPAKPDVILRLGPKTLMVAALSAIAVALLIYLLA